MKFKILRESATSDKLDELFGKFKPAKQEWDEVEDKKARSKEIENEASDIANWMYHSTEKIRLLDCKDDYDGYFIVHDRYHPLHAYSTTISDIKVTGKFSRKNDPDSEQFTLRLAPINWSELNLTLEGGDYIYRISRGKAKKAAELLDLYKDLSYEYRSYNGKDLEPIFGGSSQA